MDCPKCESKMEDVTFHGITVQRCTQCKGIWSPGVEHKELKQLHGSESIDIGDETQGKEYDEMKDVHCPECGTVMETVADRFQQHIHYEVCRKGHGVFFDAGEFRDFKEETIGDFIKSLKLYIKKKK